MVKGPPSEPLLTAREVAELFRVAPKTVLRWPKSRLPYIYTPGHHRRYRQSAVDALIGGQP